MTARESRTAPAVPAILLAAGESRRMGRPKALLEYSGGLTFVDAAILSLRSSGADPVIVVLGSEPETIRAGARLEPARIVVNPLYRLGQLSSLKAGARALPPGAPAAIVALVDQPHVPSSVARDLIAEFRRSAAPIVRPVWNGRGGHPFLLSAETFPLLLRLPDTATPFEVVNNFHDRRRDVPSPDGSILEDFDTPEEYRRAGFPRP